jgi:hypothetical protein
MIAKVRCFRRMGSFGCLCVLFAMPLSWACNPGTQWTSAPTGSGAITGSGSSLAIGSVELRGAAGGQLGRLSDSTGYTNGTDTFYTTALSDGGTFVLYRYAPSHSAISTNPYPELTVPGSAVHYVTPVNATPFYAMQEVRPPFTFAAPYREMKWPAILTDAGVGIFFVAESPIFEEAIEPYVSAYPTLRVLPSARGLSLRFDQSSASPKTLTLNWSAIEHTATTKTYEAPISDLTAQAVAIHFPHPGAAQRVWYRTGTTWVTPSATQIGGPNDPDLMVVDVHDANMLLVESAYGPPTPQSIAYSGPVGYVERARWAAFTIYQHQTPETFFRTSMTPSMKAYADRLYALRDQTPVQQFSTNWHDLLQLVGFTNGENVLNPKFFNQGFSVAGDPSFDVDPNLNVSVSWVSDEAALQAAMGNRLFGFTIDPRYAQGVKAFYDPTTSFYYGMYNRSTGKFASADTGSNGIVIGYNYLLSLTRLTELIGSAPALPASDVQKLVDRVLPVLQPGYLDDYPQVPYLWAYPNLASGVQSEYGMGRELSEAQLSYVCGLWWLRTHADRYLTCEVNALRLPLEVALTLRGSSYLWGLDVVHGAYVVDALLLAYRTTQDRRYLDAATSGWREELLFLFSTQNYPETPFDDRAMTVTSYYSTFADLSRGNYWRGDSWNNSRTLWSLSKLLTYVNDPRIVWQLQMARQTHKQSMPAANSAQSPPRSGYYNLPLDPNDLELNFEDLRTRYSTQVSYSVDVWREAYLFESVTSSSADVFRIPGVLLSDPGIAYVVGEPGSLVELTIRALDVTFADGRATQTVRLDGSGIARVELRTAGL